MTDLGTGIVQDTGWQTAEIVGMQEQTPRIKSFFLAPKQPFNFRAGQHVDVRLTAPDGYRAMRSYSIGSAPEHPNRIELAIERLDEGEVSPFFHDVAEIGDEIDIRGPLGGHFVWSVADGGPLLLLAGGSGVVPLMAMIRHRQAQASTVPTLLLLSSRDWEDVLYRDELIDLHEQNNGFTLVLTITREPPRRPHDFDRRIDAAMLSEVAARLPAAPKYVFACGSNAFVNTAADSAVACGIAAPVIRTERYGI
jgi:ferredoxin-NADP reductase